MQLRDVRNILFEIKYKGKREGLTKDDYYTLKNILKNIDSELLSTNKGWLDLYIEIENIVMDIYKSGLINNFSTSTSIYIRKHSYLLPLVLANNQEQDIKISGSNVYFNCQFHDEKNPSMRVSDLSNYLTCYACGINADVITYLLMYEKLSTKQAIQLLSQIYLFDVKTTDESLNPLVTKYQESILSDKYLEILNECQRRVDTYYTPLYEERYNTITRIKEHKYDPNFKYEEVPKIMYLGKKVVDK